MLRSIIVTVVLLSTTAFAEYAGELVAYNDAPRIVGNSIIWAADVDAGVVSDAGTPATITMSEVVIKGETDAGVPAVVPADPAAAVSMVKTVFLAVKEGNWWLAAAGFLLLVVGLLRTLGKKFHEWLPDNNVLDKPLIFLYDTKVGGWLLNWLTALAGGVGTAMAAGVPVDWSIWKSVLIVSTSGSALFELYKDIKEWWLSRKKTEPAPAPAPAPTEPPKP